MSLSVTPLIEKEGADVDGAKGVGGAVVLDRLDRNYASLSLTVVKSMAHMTEKWSEMGKGTEKWHKLRVIAEEKMSLSQVAVSLYTSIIERMKCEGKSIVRCSRRERKNRVQGSVIELLIVQIV